MYSTPAEAYCCKRKPNFGCCGKGPCNIFCCHCEPYHGPEASCNAQCENTNCNTIQWLECGGIVAACGVVCTEGAGACSLCMGVLFPTCVRCYSGTGAQCIEGKTPCPMPLSCIDGKCTIKPDGLVITEPFPETGECEAFQTGVADRDNFFESIANRDGETTTISRRDLKRFFRLEKKRTGLVPSAPFREIFDAYDTDNNNVIDRFEFDAESDETIDFIFVEPN